MSEQQGDKDEFAVEKPDDERGAHNRIGYLNVDESQSSSEAGAEEPEIAGDIDRPDD